MKILAIDFSAADRSVAAWDGTRLGEVDETGSVGTSAFRLIERALAQVQLEREEVECVAVGLGPGSYNGVRVAIAVAQGWQLARPIRLLGISDAESIAAQAQAEGLRGTLGTVIDAQRGEFYLALYELDDRGWRETAPLRIVSKPEIEQQQRAGALLAGPDLTRWFDTAKSISPRASTLVRLASTRTDFTAGAALAPIYLRETAFVKAPPRRILPPEL
jgi:tRNA threonylcarbamoyl adenosine modification protein YeaZ